MMLLRKVIWIVLLLNSHPLWAFALNCPPGLVLSPAPAQLPGELQSAEKKFAAFQTAFAANQKPAESAIAEEAQKMRDFAKSAIHSPRELALAKLYLGRFQGFVAQNYRIGLAKLGPGGESFHSIEEAVTIDPSNLEAWQAYAKSLERISEQIPLARYFTEKSLHMNIHMDATTAAHCLESCAKKDVKDGYAIELERRFESVAKKI